MSEDDKPDDHKALMLHAVNLSLQKMRSNEGGPFGAVIVKDGQVISEGWNQVTSSNDPTAHAEVMAIRKACTALDTFSLEGCEIYSSCEPCPMCLSAVYWARLDRLYFANSRDDAKAIGFDDAHIYEEVGKPVHERSIPTLHMHLPEAAAVFAEWHEKADKTEY
jgi:tRNA(Arg) A34 adenosine deaminase TadA